MGGAQNPPSLLFSWLDQITELYSSVSQVEEKASSSGLFSVEMSSVGTGDEGQC